MEAFSALLAICAGNSPVTGEFPAQRLVTRSFDVFFDLCLNKRMSKQSWGWWFETLLRTLWRHCNGMSTRRWLHKSNNGHQAMATGTRYRQFVCKHITGTPSQILDRLFHAPTRTTSSGCFMLHSEAIGDVEQTRSWTIQPDTEGNYIVSRSSSHDI